MNITGEHPSPEVIQIDKDYFPHPWTDKQWGEFNSQNLLYVLRINHEVIGFALFGISDDTAHLYKIVVVPGVRGSNVSVNFWKKLTQELREKGLHQIYLEVAVNNTAAVNFYHKVGMKDLRRIKAYYSDGDDALTMSLTL